MKGEAKGFGRKRPGADVRDRCGKMVLTAEHDIDAMLLALLYRVLFNVLVTDDKHSRLNLYRYLLTQVDDPESFQAVDPPTSEQMAAKKAPAKKRAAKK